jgi:ABC-type transport system involved in multi-copper enzyme maturation permease subunit
MQRFLSFLAHEFRLARTTIPIHAVAILEPVIMYALLTVILVHPTLDMHITQPTEPLGTALVSAMQTIGSPIGQPYINPILTDQTEPVGMRQVISIETEGDTPTAVQRFSLVDSNLVKNYRNRLTVSALALWDDTLGDQAVSVVEHPSLPEDIPYNTYFGMAMLSLAVMLAASLIGAVLTAQEFENQTIEEYRVAPTSAWLMLAARLTRLVISAAIAAGLLLLVDGWLNGFWPDSFGMVALILLPLAIIGGCMGIITGLLLKTTLPSFLLTLVVSFACWILGGSFKPPAAFGGGYELVSRWTPNTYVVNLLFPHFYGTQISAPGTSILVLTVVTVIMLALTIFFYNRNVTRAE